MANLQKLQELLSGLFQIDKAELDFGMYKIMNLKKKEVDYFINEIIPNTVKGEFEKYKQEGTIDFDKEVEELKKSAEVVGMPLEDLPKYKELKANYNKEQAEISNVKTVEREVYDYIFKFFQRYFSDGDFYSKRRYSQKNKYAIPYNGEETHFHWTNQDQYYIKTAESFNNYKWKIEKQGVNHTISFQIIQAETDTNNNKSTDKRYFILSQREPDLQKSQSIFFFEYRTLTTEEQKNYKKTKTQDLINQETYQNIVDKIKAPEVASYLTEKSTETKNNLQRHISRYSAKNSEDYFIHKDIKGFLLEELDYYIKSEVFYIEDIGTDSEKLFKEGLYLLMGSVKVIKAVCKDIIDFVAQMENYQKKLFEKKKLIYGVNYCVSLSNINENLWEDIINNEDQIAEWKELGMIEENTKINTDLLKEQNTLVIDTKHFSPEWKWKLLGTIEDLDSKTNGVLISSENFQALKMLEGKYKEKIKCVYIDPPYNTGGDGFIYKDGYQHSSWLSLMKDRLIEAKKLMEQGASIFISIDNNEVFNLKILCDSIFSIDNFIANIIWEKNFSPKNNVNYFSENSDYILCYSKNKEFFKRNLLPITEEQKSRYKNIDNDSRGKWTSSDLSVMGTNKERIYELETPGGKKLMPPNGRCWSCSKDKLKEMIADNRIYFGSTGNNTPRVKRFLSEIQSGKVPMTIWKYQEVGHTQESKQEMKALNGEDIFGTPKPVRLLKRIGELATDNNSIILDFFAGSGTTGQAVMNLNKEDGGNRKFLLVEMGEYFDSVLLKRIKKVMYSDNWKEGKAVDNDGHNQIIKYFSLEQYEDTLNNLTITDKGIGNLPLADQKEYFLNYVLDLETKGSLFDINNFDKPFDYEMKISQNGEIKDTKIDLVETFNYLIGLNVKSIKRYENGIITIAGSIEEMSKTKETLVVWRDITQLTQEDFTDFYTKNIKGNYDTVFINGGTYNIPEAELIEAEFFKKMFV